MIENLSHSANITCRHCVFPFFDLRIHNILLIECWMFNFNFYHKKKMASNNISPGSILTVFVDDLSIVTQRSFIIFFQTSVSLFQAFHCCSDKTSFVILIGELIIAFRSDNGRYYFFSFRKRSVYFIKSLYMYIIVGHRSSNES